MFAREHSDWSLLLILSLAGNPPPFNLASHNTLLLKLDLLAKVGRSSIRIVTQGVASGVLGNEHEELIVRHRQAELVADVIVALRRLVASTAGAVEGLPRVDTGSCDVTAVLA